VNRRLLLLLVVLLGGGLIGGSVSAAAERAAVIQESTWEAGGLDSWSAFTVRVSSERGFRGELVLEPAPLRQASSQIPPPPDTPSPSVRTPIVLEAGVERLVSVMVPVGDTAYRATLRDTSGALVFTGQGRRAPARTSNHLGLLTDRRNGEALVQVGSLLPLSFTRRFRSVADFPTDVLRLAGLDAIVVGDFDSASLGGEQRQALLDFVGLGGSLVVTGGDAATRTVAPLPEALVPLRPEATTSASLAPLADLAGQTTDIVTPVATGQLRSGRVLVGGLHGPPLVIQASYGWGHVIQLTYDPFAVTSSSPATAGLRAIPYWSTALMRATKTADALPLVRGDQSSGPPAPEWSVLDWFPGPPPARGGPAGPLLVVYPLLIGGAAFVLGRGRGRRPAEWLALPVLVAVVTAAVVPVGWGLGASRLTSDEIAIERLGPPGTTATVESYHRLMPSGRTDVAVSLGNPSLGSSAPAPRPPYVPPVKHVFVINIENKGYDETWGVTSTAPYLAHKLRKQGGRRDRFVAQRDRRFLDSRHLQNVLDQCQQILRLSLGITDSDSLPVSKQTEVSVAQHFQRRKNRREGTLQIVHDHFHQIVAHLLQLAELSIAALERVGGRLELEKASDAGTENEAVVRLGEKIVATGFDSLHSVAGIVESSDEDDGDT